jgi:RNA polymerase sigma factor (sigma-70 family)
VAEDLALETFWRIYRARHRFDHNGSFGAWAYRIATNLALDHLRRRPMTVQLVDDICQQTNGDPVLQREQREKIHSALLSLPPRFQVVVTMSLIDQHSHREIAEALRISPGTVKSRVFRAVRMLRRKLEQMGVKQ